MGSIKHYRAFQVDRDGHVAGCINLVCDDDEQAKREAAALVQVHRIELWRLDQRIAKFDARQEPVRSGAIRERRACLDSAPFESDRSNTRSGHFLSLCKKHISTTLFHEDCHLAVLVMGRMRC